MAIVEVFLGAFLTLLLNKMASGEWLEFLRHEGIHTQLSNWTNTLSQIQALLTDAEDKQLTIRAVNLWLDDLQDLAYDLDDIVDDFSTEALRRKLMSEQPQASSSKEEYVSMICSKMRRTQDKAIKRFLVRNIVEQAAVRDVQEACAFSQVNYTKTLTNNYRGRGHCIIQLSDLNPSITSDRGVSHPPGPLYISAISLPLALPRLILLYLTANIWFIPRTPSQIFLHRKACWIIPQTPFE